MLTLTFGLLLAAAGVASQETGQHPDWPRWCGKVYKSGYPSFEPGGRTVEPPKAVDGPRLLVEFKPRFSLYLDGEKEGQFVVNAALSPYYGAPLPDITELNAKLDFEIKLDSTGATLLKDSVSINSTGTLFPFGLTPLKARLDGQNVTLTGVLRGHNKTYASTSEILYLPEKTKGSVTKLDNAFGGMLFRNTKTGGRFVPLFPYGYYASHDRFLGEPDAPARIRQYADYGLNAMTPLTHYPESAAVFAYMDAIDLRYQYDLREGYKNLTWVEENIRAARENEGLYSIWNADEPDGWQDPFNASVLSYRLIRGLDPYHPVATTLNCQDYYFAAYSAGADVLMEDTYPIGINTTGLSKWGTLCNATLGDCGCDNCVGGAHAVRDVRDRLDALARYERWEALWPKTKFHNPQSFHGEDYWARDPTPAEEFAMNLVAVNHGAQGVVSWVYPAAEVLNVAHGQLARVLTRSPVVDFVVANDRPHAVEAAASSEIDVAYWVRGKEMLVSVVNSGYNNITARVEVELPGAVSLGSILWGNATWGLAGKKLWVSGYGPLETSLVVVKLS